MKRSNTGQNTNTRHTTCATNALRKTEYTEMVHANRDPSQVSISRSQPVSTNIHKILPRLKNAVQLQSC